MARACPVLGLGLVVASAVGGGWGGWPPPGCGWPPEPARGWGFATHSPPMWFHFSFPLARNNWPGGWTRVAALGVCGGPPGRTVASGRGSRGQLEGVCVWVAVPSHLFIPDPCGPAGCLRNGGRGFWLPSLVESPSPACWEAPGLSQVLGVRAPGSPLEGIHP